MKNLTKFLHKILNISLYGFHAESLIFLAYIYFYFGRIFPKVSEMRLDISILFEKQRTKQNSNIKNIHIWILYRLSPLLEMYELWARVSWFILQSPLRYNVLFCFFCSFHNFLSFYSSNINASMKIQNVIRPKEKTEQKNWLKWTSEHRREQRKPYQKGIFSFSNSDSNNTYYSMHNCVHLFYSILSYFICSFFLLLFHSFWFRAKTKKRWNSKGRQKNWKHIWDHTK